MGSNREGGTVLYLRVYDLTPATRAEGRGKRKHERGRVLKKGGGEP